MSSRVLHARLRCRQTAGALLTALLALAASDIASAHANGRSELQITAGTGTGLAAVWSIDAADLQLPLELDRNGDGVLTAHEILGRRASITRFAASRLEIRRDGQPCTFAVHEVAVVERASVPWARLSLDGSCPRTGALEVSTRLFFGSPGYSAWLDVATPAGKFAAALSMARASWREPPRPSALATLLQFFREGLWHVLIGYDHVAFLLLLVLPSVLRRSGSGWTPVLDQRAVLVDLLKTVTGFTLAHSVTLALAASGTVRIPEQPVEVAIASSIVVAGLLNLWSAAAGWRLALASGFGLVHGFGFANALQEIAEGGAGILPMLGGFNLGIECAQLLLVAALLPLLWLLSRRQLYVTRILPGLSIATALTGAVWFAARL